MKALAASVGLALAMAAPATAQEGAAPKAIAAPRTASMLPIRHPSPVRVTGRKAIDIPQAAKAAGHNGSATWLASVGTDGTAIALTLEKSSNSRAIDAAARGWAENASYLPATDAVGNRVKSQVRVHLQYARWDHESPGGGLDDYRCADLLREADWFASANAGEKRIFPLENFYTSLASLRLMEQGLSPSRAERGASRAKALKDWRKLLGRCRKEPERLFLDFVDDSAFYRRVAEAL